MINMISISKTYNTPRRSLDPSFKGGKFNVIKYAFNPQKKVDITYVKCLMGISDKVIQQELANGIVNPINNLNAPLSRHRAGFFARLAEKFCEEMFGGNRLNGDILRKRVYDIYDTVKYPDNAHKAIVSTRNFNLSELETLFNTLKGESKKIKLVAKLLSTAKSTNCKKIGLDEMLCVVRSDYASKLNKNFSSYDKDIAKLIRQNPDQNLSLLLRRYFDELALKS